MAPRSPEEELAVQATAILAEYVRTPTTDLLKKLAPVIVELRSHHRLNDGSVDWSGRSPAYRKIIAEIYRDAHVSDDGLDRLQTALRYHVGNVLRERAPSNDLQRAGLTDVSPRERTTTSRQAFQAMKEASAPRQDIPRLTAYAQALLEYVDEAAACDLTAKENEAARIALQSVQSRAAELLVRLRDAGRNTPTRK